MFLILIILFELIILYSVINKISQRVPNIKLIFLFSFMINSFVLMIYRVELINMGREVYFSDSEVYWDATINMLKGNSAQTWNMGYVYYSYIIQKLSIITSPVFINISNMLLTYLSIFLLALIMIDNNVGIKNIKFFIVSNIFNLLIFYSLFRNLKDALFLFYTILTVLLVNNYFSFKYKKQKIIIVTQLFIMVILLYSIRPWGFLIPFCTFFVGLIINKRINIKNTFSIIITILLITLVVFNTKMRHTLNMWVPIVLERGLSRSIINLLLGPINLIVGPGPIRSILGNIYFLHTTNVGNFASFLGSILWWFYLPFLITIIRLKEIKKNPFIYCLGIVLVLFMSIYTLQYGGSAEIRFRGVLYVLFSGFIMSAFTLRINKNMLVKYLLWVLVVFIGGIAFGL